MAAEMFRGPNTFLLVIIAEFICRCFASCYTGDSARCSAGLSNAAFSSAVNGKEKANSLQCKKSKWCLFFPPSSRFTFSIATNAISEALQPKQQRRYRCQLFYLRAPIFSNGSICFCGILEMISRDWLNDVTNSRDCR